MEPAIVVVGYNRIGSIKRLLKSIENAFYGEWEVPLIISLDKSNVTDEIMKVAEHFKWSYGPKEIIVQEENIGLRRHVIKCGDLSFKYGSVIILEDDLVVSKGYYNYVIQALSKYRGLDNVAGISLYSHDWNGYARSFFTPQKNGFDTYFGQFSISWGQCWTAEQWKGFKDWYRDNNTIVLANDNLPDVIDTWGDNSWGKYFAHYIVEKNLYYVIPYTSLSTNYSEEGEHTIIADSTYQVTVLDDCAFEYRFPDFQEAIKYDMFFERLIDEGTILNGISVKEVCFDLHGLKRKCSNKKYVATTRKISKAAPVCTYGIRLRPIEQNVLSEEPGFGIYVYKINDFNKGKKTCKRHGNYIAVELRNFRINDIWNYLLFRYSKGLRKKIIHFIKNR